jgi:hypothetical protein
MNILRTYTTPEQVSRLIFNLDVSTADMYYINVPEFNNTPLLLTKDIDLKNDCLKYTPCWSLGALLKLLPLNAKINFERYSLRLSSGCVSYIHDDREKNEYFEFSFNNDDFFTNVFEMVRFLIVKGVIKQCMD